MVDKGMKEKIKRLAGQRKIEMMDLDQDSRRSIQKCYVIVDEIQNLPPSHVKAIATRGGEGTKMVFTGDFSYDQIDVPWLDERSNGLSVLNAKWRAAVSSAACTWIRPFVRNSPRKFWSAGKKTDAKKRRLCQRAIVSSV